MQRQGRSGKIATAVRRICGGRSQPCLSPASRAPGRQDGGLVRSARAEVTRSAWSRDFAPGHPVGTPRNGFPILNDEFQWRELQAAAREQAITRLSKAAFATNLAPSAEICGQHRSNRAILRVSDRHDATDFAAKRAGANALKPYASHTTANRRDPGYGATVQIVGRWIKGAI